MCRNHNSRGKIVKANQNDENEERDSTPILMSPDPPRGKGKRMLTNNFFITNALYQNDESANKSSHQNDISAIKSPRFQQDAQNSYFVVSDRYEKDE